MSAAVQAYRHVAASPEFREIARLRSKARHDEAQALRNAQRQRDEHWQGVVAEVVAEKDARIAELVEKDTRISEVVAEKDTRIAELEALIKKQQ